ncbi:serine hydrolase [Janibacter sp. YB324]|uniref:serine hydrolase domain-containing protein n=1 Tax=Janibacter sp. YB324 TaxID=2761047 RepID=UPI00162AEEE1|nr:serine hydrolase domain-containing protein [Janibacter sp. YB324]QNF93286.1 beta-lactamase family protein [Janibacter sp. YB324]
MRALEDLTRTLDRLLGAGDLAGWAVGVADPDGASVRVGGARSPGGVPMTPDTQVALSSSTKPIGGVLALRLVELGALTLDEPVAPWLPELDEPRVLVGPEADLTATVPAERPITLRHLLTMTPGFGWVSEPGPLADALAREQVAPGPFCPPMSPDDFMRRLGSLPLADQPGTAWRYHTSSDVLGVLLARATGTSVPELLTEHVLQPLGMTETGYTATRLAPPLAPEEGGPGPVELPAGTFVAPPPFASLATGLVSTLPDQLAFLRSLVGGPAVLSPESLAALRTGTLTDEQRRTAAGFIEPGCDWGLTVRSVQAGRWAGPAAWAPSATPTRPLGGPPSSQRRSPSTPPRRSRPSTASGAFSTERHGILHRHGPRTRPRRHPKRLLRRGLPRRHRWSRGRRTGG